MVEPVAHWEVADSMPSDESAVPESDANWETMGPGPSVGSALPNHTLPTVMEPLVPDVGNPATCYDRTPVASLQPVLPFGPASVATQSLEGGKLGQIHRIADKDTQVTHETSRFTTHTLGSAGDPPPMTATPGVTY